MGVVNGYGSSGSVRQSGVADDAGGERGDGAGDPLAGGAKTVADEQATATKARRGKIVPLGLTDAGFTG